MDLCSPALPPGRNSGEYLTAAERMLRSAFGSARRIQVDSYRRSFELQVEVSRPGYANLPVSGYAVAEVMVVSRGADLVLLFRIMGRQAVAHSELELCRRLEPVVAAEIRKMDRRIAELAPAA